MHRLFAKKRKSGKVVWNKAPDIEKKIADIVEKLDLNWIDKKGITCYFSEGSTTRAYARIWGLSKVWQMALKVGPHYIIETISEKYDRLTPAKQAEVLIHELMHIPKNFSGALIPHIKKRGARNFHDKVSSYVGMLEKMERL